MNISHATISADDLTGASFPSAQPSDRYEDGRLLLLLGDETTWLRATPEELQAISQRFLTLATSARDARLERERRSEEVIARAFGPEPRVART